MKNKLTSVDLLGYHHHTALLESVGWDEEALEEFVKHVTDYLKHASSKETISQDDWTILLSNVEDNWGAPAKDVLKSIFNLEYTYLNLATQRSQDVN